MTEDQGWLSPSHHGSESQLTQTNQKNQMAIFWGGQGMGCSDQPNKGRALESGKGSIWERWKGFLVVKPVDYS